MDIKFGNNGVSFSVILDINWAITLYSEGGSFRRFYYSSDV